LPCPNRRVAVNSDGMRIAKRGREKDSQTAHGFGLMITPANVEPTLSNATREWVIDSCVRDATPQILARFFLVVYTEES
jgi:hypothetical protein